MHKGNKAAVSQLREMGAGYHCVLSIKGDKILPKKRQNNCESSLDELNKWQTVYSKETHWAFT